MIVSKTPLRISLFGGGTDLEGYYSKGYGCVLNAAIDKYVYIMVNRKFDDAIQLKYSLTETVDFVDDVVHPTIREAMKYTYVQKGIELGALADFPANGTGLGSSSSFLVGALNALSRYNGREMNAEALARGACEIEIEKLGEPCGKQDQYVAAYGGFNFTTFNRNGSVDVRPVGISDRDIKRLKNKLLFFYTGIGRRSNVILKEQKNNIDEKMGYLDKMRKLAEIAKDRLENGDVEAIGKLLDEGWQLKKNFASNITSEFIDGCYQRAIDAGAVGGKILGAGGGGFFMFYSEPETHSDIRKVLQPMREVFFDFPARGSEIVYDDK